VESILSWVPTVGYLVAGLGILVIVVWTANYVWKKYWPSSSGGTVGTALGNVANLAEKAAAAAGLETVVQVFSSWGDSETVNLLSPIWAKIWAHHMPDPVPTPAPVIPVVTGPTTVAVKTVDGATVEIQVQPVIK
jgi:hypothetical protein